MASIYKETAVKSPTNAQISEIACQLGYDLGTAEIQEYKGQYASDKNAGLLITVTKYVNYRSTMSIIIHHVPSLSQGNLSPVECT